MITPQAGDVWKVAYGPSPPRQLYNYWYIHEPPSKYTNRWYKKQWTDSFRESVLRLLGNPLIMVTNSGDDVRVPDNVEDNKNGWELCFRPGWVKLIENNWPLDSKKYIWCKEGTTIDNFSIRKVLKNGKLGKELVNVTKENIDSWEDKMTENEMLRIALDKMTKALDDLVRDCLDENEKHRVPSYKALMRARGFLTPSCPMSFSPKNKIPGITLDKTGNVSPEIDAYLRMIPKEKSGPRMHAFGILCHRIPKDTGTIIINEQSFACYNYEMDDDTMKLVVDSMDATERMKVDWATNKT